MRGVSREFYALFDKTAAFLKPISVDSFSGLGWVILELLNNAVRAPVSIAMNKGLSDLNEISFYSTIKIIKKVTAADKGKSAEIEISIMNSGEYIESVALAIQDVLEGKFTILECEERFMLKGSCTGNGGMGLILSQKNIKNGLGGELTFAWHDGFYVFSIRYKDSQYSEKIEDTPRDNEP